LSQIEIFTAAQVLDSGIKIPSPPTLLTELNSLLDAPDVDIGKLAALISRDAGATAMLFKLAGSPMFGGRKVPDAIDGVINMLGLSVVADLLRGMMLRAAMPNEAPFYIWFWERSDAIADIAGQLASKIRSARISPSHARLATLFMDCGVAVLTTRFPDYLQGFETPTGQGYLWPKVRQTDAQFNTNHAVVGGLIAKHWKLPEYVCEAIQKHHDTDFESPQVGSLVALMQLATYVYQQKRHNEDPSWDICGASAMERLQLNDDDVLDLIDEV